MVAKINFDMVKISDTYSAPRSRRSAMAKNPLYTKTCAITVGDAFLVLGLDRGYITYIVKNVVKDLPGRKFSIYKEGESEFEVRRTA